MNSVNSDTSSEHAAAGPPRPIPTGGGAGIRLDDLTPLRHAIDTWEGDQHIGRYGPEVLADLRAHHDTLYEGFSRLNPGTFDQAVAGFADGSIDLLDIDGTHTYDAVRHDFET